MFSRKPAIIAICSALIVLFVISTITILIKNNETKDAIKYEDFGQIIDVGNIKAVCPEGWYNCPVSDTWSDDENAIDKNTLYFIKGANKDSDFFTYPSIHIDYYGDDNVIIDTRDTYTDVQDVNLNINGVEWEGFTGKFGNYLNGVLNVKDSGAICISLCLEASNGSYTLNDEDVKAILGSVEVATTDNK